MRIISNLIIFLLFAFFAGYEQNLRAMSGLKLSHNSFIGDAEIDTMRLIKLNHFVGLQYLGTANNVLPFYGVELKWPTKYSILGQIGLGVDPNWRPPSFEIIVKILNNYYFHPRFALNYGFGMEQRFNPWFMADPNSYNFTENCQFGWCPEAIREYFIDLGIQIALSKNLRWQLVPKYNYKLNHKNSDLNAIHFATLELKYSFL